MFKLDITEAVKASMTEEEYQEMVEEGERPFRGKTPQELAEMALGEGDHGKDHPPPLRFGGKPENPPMPNDIFLRLNAIRRLSDVDAELAGRVAEKIVADRKAYHSIRTKALGYLTEEAADRVLPKIALDTTEDPYVRDSIFLFSRGFDPDVMIAIAKNKEDNIKLRRRIFDHPELPEKALFDTAIDPAEDNSLRLQALNDPKLSNEAAAKAIEDIVKSTRNYHSFRITALYNARLPASVAEELALFMAKDHRYGMLSRKTALNHPAISQETRKAVIEEIAASVKGNPAKEFEFSEVFGDSSN